MKKYIPLGALACALIAALILLNDDLHRELKDNPDKELHCLFADGWRHVPTERIKSFDGIRWYFKNGSAKRCRIIK